jgi:hypothetical protein
MDKVFDQYAILHTFVSPELPDSALMTRRQGPNSAPYSTMVCVSAERTAIAGNGELFEATPSQADFHAASPSEWQLARQGKLLFRPLTEADRHSPCSSIGRLRFLA